MHVYMKLVGKILSAEGRTKKLPARIIFVTHEDFDEIDICGENASLEIGDNDLASSGPYGRGYGSPEFEEIKKSIKKIRNNL